MGALRRYAGIVGILGGIVMLLFGLTADVARAAPSVTVSSITAKFFANPTNDGAFTATSSSTPDFTLTVAALNWNPPTEAQVTCSNATNVDENTRPFTDVVRNADGTCTTIPAVSGGISEGCDTSCTGYTGPDRNAFNAEFEGTFTVSEAGNVTFNFFSDDGWILGVAANGSNQPTHVSGGNPSPPALTTTAFKGYKVVGENNTTHAPTQDDLVVNFPAAGTYAFELDYAEGAQGELAMTMNAGGAPIGSTATTNTTAATTATTATTPTPVVENNALTTTTRAPVVFGVTGSDNGPLVGVALALLFAGAVLLAGRRISDQPLDFPLDT
jgi:hypothetical protein